ncbi:MAG: hypothetical protein NT018_08520 [Armatimonadetes bacterium]|nr:hypothetical protein [Armatimonadota bacterium]
MSNEEAADRKISLARALKNGFLSAYDHLGYVVCASLICSALSLAVYGLTVMSTGFLHGASRLLVFIPALLVAFICAAGVFYYANMAAFEKRPAVIDTLMGARKLLVPAIELFFVDGFITAVLLVSSAFFVSRMGTGSLYLAAALLSAYLLLIWLIVAMYHLPLLAAQLDMESGPKPLVIMRKSFLLTIDNLCFTVCLFVVIIAIVMLCALPRFIGILAIFLGVISFVLNHALKELFKKYGILQPEAEPVKDEAWRLPESWRKRGSGEDFPEE